MGFSRVAALHLAPLLARIVLCAAFVPIGWQKIMTMETYTGSEATTIRSLRGMPSGEDASTTDAAGTSEAGDGGQTVATDPDSIEARRVYGLAMMLSAKDVPYPVAAAWLAAITELVGGGLLLVGLLSRIWALGLAVTMGMAFALTSCTVIAATGPFDLALPDYLRAVSQLALGTLALMVLLTGPGAIAIDHGIFGRRPATTAAATDDSWDKDE